MNFLNKIAHKSLIIISSFLALYTLYRSEIVWLGEKREFYLGYLLFSFFLFIFGFIFQYFNEEFKTYSIITIISLIFGFYSFEFYLIYKNELQKFFIYKKNHGVKYDNRSKYELYKDLNKSGNYVVTIAGKLYNSILEKENFFPLSGISNSNTINCNENGYFSIYKSDRFGFNNPDNLWEKKDIEYLIVGDSFVHGNCVNRPNDITSVLRNISKKNAINLGYSHHRGPLMQYASLREYLNPNVKKVIWVYFEGNDLYDLNNELKNKILIKYFNDLSFNQNLKSNQNRIDRIAKKIISKKLPKTKDESLLFKFSKLYYTRDLIRLTLTPRTVLLDNKLELKKILKLTKDLIEKNNSKLFFVYLPNYNRYTSKYVNTNYDQIKKIIDELQIPFIDIHNEVFSKEQNPLNLFPFGINGHYNIEGYRKTAKVIYDYTRERLNE